MTNSSRQHDTIHDFIKDNDQNRWCYDYVDIPQDYEPLLCDLTKGQVILISDGSYNPKNNYSSAAWILEGKTSSLHFSGRVITPGQAEIQSAYRSELAGILAAVSFINTVAAFHKITTSVTLLCNCETGLEKSFSRKPLTLKDSSYDLLQAIHYELTHTTIQ